MQIRCPSRDNVARKLSEIDESAYLVPRNGAHGKDSAIWLYGKTHSPSAIHSSSELYEILVRLFTCAVCDACLFQFLFYSASNFIS